MMESSTFFTDINFLAIAPQIIVAGGAINLMLLSAFIKSQSGKQYVLSWITSGFFIAAGFMAYTLLNDPGVTVFEGMVSSNTYAHGFNILFCVIGFSLAIIAPAYLKKMGLSISEFYTLLLFAVTGMMFMTSAEDLLVFFIGLETLSLPLYVLAALNQTQTSSVEAGFKYFLMGAFAAGFQLLGMAFIFGTTGSTSVQALHDYIVINGVFANGYMPLGLLLTFAGIGFKISMAPFHLWTPDVYQGSPVIVTALISTGPKAAAFAFLLKITWPFFTLLDTAPEGSMSYYQNFLSVFAILTMVAGKKF